MHCIKDGTNIDSRFGSGHYFKNSDDTLTVELTRNSTGRFVIPAMPNLVQTLPGLFSYSEANILYSKDGVNTETTAGLSAYQELLDKAIEDGIVAPIVPVSTGNYYQSTSSVLNQGYHTDQTFYSIHKYIY